jgi:hypothetical protein
MIKERAWPTKAMYMLLAAALAISLIIMVAPAQKASAAPDEVKAEWEMTDTPTIDGWVLAPESTIYDYALASEGDVAYAIVEAYDDTCGDKGEFVDYGYRLLKSDNGAATWTDLTDTLVDQLNDDGYNFTQLLQVATDWIDPDFLAVALMVDSYDNTAVHVYISTDGGDTFFDSDEVYDSTEHTSLVYVSDLAVSLPVSGVRNIGVGGVAYDGSAYYGVIFRATVTVSSEAVGKWVDTTSYDGWLDSEMVTDLIFSPNWPTDSTILAVTYGQSSTGPGPYDVYLQSGTWGKTTASSAWNADAGFAAAVAVKKGIGLPTFLIGMFNARAIAGVALPSDYDGTNSALRYAWVWVNYYNASDVPTGEIFMILNSAATSINQQLPGMPWLTNVSYLGTHAQGTALAGVLGDGTGDFVDCCVGVQVYHNNSVANMNICCIPWEPACKLPSGRAGMAVSYVDANNAGTAKPDKAYAVALYGIPYRDNDGLEYGPYDESAWSVSVDHNHLVWNQLSLIDTYIDYISDVAVSPDCNKMMLVTVNIHKVCVEYENDYCDCDSVWLKATNLPEDEEYSGYWIRTWFGQLTGDNSDDFPWVTERGLLRLPPASQETNGDTVYLLDRMTGTIYYNDMETWDCWTKGASSIDNIVDLAVLDEATIYALGSDGDVAMSDDHGKAVSWTDPVDSELDNGWTIAVHGNNATDVLVGGQDADVSYSDDGGETFTALDDVLSTNAEDVHVTVAFDTYFDTNDIVYAALANAGDSNNGIFSTTVPDSEGWTDLGANGEFNYTGLVVSYLGGNPFTSADAGGVIYASYYTWEDNCDCPGCEELVGTDSEVVDGDCYCWDSGVARSLTPITEAAVCPTCEQSLWDYLTWGLDESVQFIMAPQALKVCGCTDASTDTKLFAIDGPKDDDACGYYDMCAGEEGTVWTFEDCYAKKAVELVSPANDFVVGTSSCGCCNVPFTLKWDRLCDACCYEIQFALDEDFTQPYYPEMLGDSQYVPDFECYCPGEEVGPAAAVNPSAFLGCFFQPETTYYWRVRTTQAATGQEIHSWWSDPQSFRVAPTAATGAIDLVAPVVGATDVGIKNVGFSWNTLATVDSYDWTLSPNADLSSPLGTKTGLTGTATTYTGTPLTYGTTYYWQVKAYNEGALISTSPIGTFTTTPHGAFCSAIDGACFDTQAALDAHNADLQKPAGTPFWVWVVIGIGAVLVIVVIVLIFRTRRV